MYQTKRLYDESPKAHEPTNYEASQNSFDFRNSAMFSVGCVVSDENTRTYCEDDLKYPLGS